MSNFIEDDGEKPSPVKTGVRWVLAAVMLYLVYNIGTSLYAMKHEESHVGAVWSMVFSCFFFIIFYAVYWLLRD